MFFRRTCARTCKRNADASQGLRDTSQPAAALTLESGSAWYTAKTASPGVVGLAHEKCVRKEAKGRAGEGQRGDKVYRCYARIDAREKSPPSTYGRHVRERAQAVLSDCMEIALGLSPAGSVRFL